MRQAIEWNYNLYAHPHIRNSEQAAHTGPSFLKPKDHFSTVVPTQATLSNTVFQMLCLPALI